VLSTSDPCAETLHVGNNNGILLQLFEYLVEKIFIFPDKAFFVINVGKT
jgi:hypothetical protein